MAASAMNPLPCVIPSKYRRACSMARYAPAIPARAPLSNTPAYRRWYTLTPSVSAASGYSPTARSRSPNRVRLNTHWLTATSTTPVMTSSPIFTTPPRSACTAPSDASRIGIVTRIAEARSATLNSEVMYSILQLSDSSTSCRLRRWCRGHRELCLALALGPHVPGQQLVRDHDGQDDERLQDDDNLFGHPGEELHPRRPAVQEAEQQRRRDHAQGIVLGQQGHGDPQEPEALGEVDIQVSKKAEDVVEPDQASDAGAEHEHSKLGARVGNAGRLRGQRVERHRPHLIAKPGAAEKVG